MKKKVYLVPHCHWDREWYFSSDTADVLFHSNMKDLIQNINKQKMFLDGQWSLLDDYTKDNRGDEQLIKKLLENGNISSGPFYSQPDVFNSQGETILRNIEVGESEAKKYGIKNNKTAYLPDTFGFSENFPNLLRHKGIENFVFWRGIPKDVVEKSVYNNWNNNDNSIRSLCLKNGYYTLGMHYPYNGNRGLYPEKWNPKLFASKIYKRMDEQKGFNNIYIFPLGGDQAPFIENQNKFISLVQKHMLDCEIVLVENYEKFFDETKNQSIPIYKGILNYAYTGKIHRTIASSRYDIKKLFRDAEDKLYCQLEPLEIFYKTIDKGYDFEKYKIERILKPLLIAQTHDSLGGCNTDTTNKFQINRLNKIHENIDSQIDLLIKKIMQEENLFEEEVFIFNPSLSENSVFKRMFVYSKDYDAININKDDVFIKTISSINISLVEKPLYKMEIIIFADKLKGLSYKWFDSRENTFINSEKERPLSSIDYNGLKIKFKAIVEEGDSYDSSPGKELKVVQKHMLIHSFKISAKTKWSEIKTNLTVNGVTQTFIWDILDSSGELEILGFTENIFKDIKLSLVIEGIEGNELYVSQNLGMVNVQNKEPDPKWKDNLHEYPINIGVTDCVISNNKYNIMTFGNNEIIRDGNNLEIALFRTYNFVTNKDLKWRPSTSGLSWYEYAGESQLQHRLDFRFVINKGKDINAIFNKYKFSPYIYKNQQRNFIANKMTKFVINNVLKKGSGKIIIKSLNKAAISSIKLNGSDINVRLHNLNKNVVNEKIIINGIEKTTTLKQNEIKQLTFKGVGHE